jgi:argininosuccinate lyase
MKLWQKKTTVDSLIEKFTIGKDKEVDLSLAYFDVIGSLAHAAMLVTINILKKEEFKILYNELLTILNNIQQENFKIEDGIEDVHSQIEILLTQKIGDIGKKIHSGRSRNDQVLLDIKLYSRDKIHEIVNHVEKIFNLLQELSEQYKNIILPGYTHLQIAMPSSFGLWFGAYAESLVDDLILMHSAYKICNKNPLGSGAGYGSSFPLNRKLTTELLGFDELHENVVYAQMTRGKTEWFISNAIASIANTLSRFSMDICLYMSQNFNFISLPENLTTGSSIMPHKKNPDVFELIRAKCNQLKALPNQILMINTNLPSGYHRDMQQIKELFFPAFEIIIDCLIILQHMLPNIIVNSNIVENEIYKYMFSVEKVNALVLDGIPFRDAYMKISNEIADGTFKPNFILNHTHEGSIGNLRNNSIKKSFYSILKEFNFTKKDEAIANLITGKSIKHLIN